MKRSLNWHSITHNKGYSFLKYSSPWDGYSPDYKDIRWPSNKRDLQLALGSVFADTMRPVKHPLISLPNNLVGMHHLKLNKEKTKLKQRVNSVASTTPSLTSPTNCSCLTNLWWFNTTLTIYSTIRKRLCCLSYSFCWVTRLLREEPIRKICGKSAQTVPSIPTASYAATARARLHIEIEDVFLGEKKNAVDSTLPTVLAAPASRGTWRWCRNKIATDMALPLSQKTARGITT